jgi:beta-galactosidase
MFAELLTPNDACGEKTEVLLKYDNPAWSRYAAAVYHRYGKGAAFYLGAMPDREALDEILARAVKEAGIELPPAFAPLENADPAEGWTKKTPEALAAHTVAIRKGVNQYGKTVVFYLNYSAWTQEGIHAGADGINLLDGAAVKNGEKIILPPWGLAVVES